MSTKMDISFYNLESEPFLIVRPVGASLPSYRPDVADAGRLRTRRGFAFLRCRALAGDLEEGIHLVVGEVLECVHYDLGPPGSSGSFGETHLTRQVALALRPR